MSTFSDNVRFLSLEETGAPSTLPLSIRAHGTHLSLNAWPSLPIEYKKCVSSDQCLPVSPFPLPFPPTGKAGTDRQHNKPTRSLLIRPLPKQCTLHKFLSLPELAPQTASNENKTWGHMMDDIDHSKTLRILLQNPNGIRPNHTDLDFQYGLSKCSSFGVGIMSISETKMNWTTAATQTTYQWFHQIWKFSSLSSSQINENFSS
jgi:hypothetical protein